VTAGQKDHDDSDLASAGNLGHPADTARGLSQMLEIRPEILLKTCEILRHIEADA
jgi:hypothetical protein